MTYNNQMSKLEAFFILVLFKTKYNPDERKCSDFSSISRAGAMKNRNPSLGVPRNTKMNSKTEFGAVN